MNRHIIEKLQIASGFVPVNLATASNPGDWVSLKNFYRCAVVVFKGVGTAGDDPTVTLEQATSVAGAGAKALNFTRVEKKQGADLLAIGDFTTVTQAEGNTFTHTDLAEQQAIIVIDVDADSLDIDNGFDCIRATVSDVGSNAQLGAMLYLLHDSRVTASGKPPSGIGN